MAQAAFLKLRIKEVAVPRVYLDPKRTFGGVLNDADERLSYYRRVIAEAENGIPSEKQEGTVADSAPPATGYTFDCCAESCW